MRRPTLVDGINRLDHVRQLRAGEGVRSAVANAQPGGTVSLAPEEFTLSGTVTVDKSLSIVGCQPGSVVNVGSGLGTSIATTIAITAEDVFISGIHFKTTSAGICLEISADKVFISNCTFEGFDTGVKLRDCDSIIIRDCAFFSGGGTAGDIAAVDMDYSIVANNISDRAANSHIVLDSLCQKNVVVGNQGKVGSINIVNGSAQGNVYSANQPAATVT